MAFGKWFFGAIAAGLALGAAGAQAAPMPVVTAEVRSSVQPVQYYYEDDAPVFYDAPRRPYGPPPVVVYDPPPPRYYGPPRERYYGPPRDRWEHRPPPPPIQPRPGPYGGFWDKEQAKDYVKGLRRAEKDAFKEKQRAWNRANGY